MAIDYAKLDAIINSAISSNPSGTYGPTGAFTPASSALIPSPSQAPGSLAALIPSRPTYTPYTPTAFDSSATGPGGEYGWSWTKGIKSKELHDTEQKDIAAQLLQKYNADVGGWQSKVDLAQDARDYQYKLDLEDRRRLENQYSQIGKVAPISATDITPQIRQFGQSYMTAQGAGDQAGMDAAHKAALDLAIKAGWLQPGQDVESVSSLPQMTLAGTPTFDARRLTAQDARQAAQDAMNPQSQDWYLPVAKQQAEATLANTLRSANAPYPSSGGGGTSKPTQTDRQNATTSEAMQSINEAIAQGKSRAWITDAINRATPTWVNDGVNIKTVSEYFASQKTADENQQAQAQAQEQQSFDQYSQDQSSYNKLPFWKKWGTEDPYYKFTGR